MEELYQIRYSMLMLITPKQAFEQQLRDIYLITEGTIAEILPNDTTGIPHQRFIIITPDGQSMLIVHNIERGEPLDLLIGQKLHIEGTYVWNPRGGLIHETHIGHNKNRPEGLIIKNTV
jgi:hypothetical protein